MREQYVAAVDLTLASGRWIWSNSILIQDTYGGLLEGFPDHEMNERILARIPEQVHRTHGAWSLHLIQPPRRTEIRTMPVGPSSLGLQREIEDLPSHWVAAKFYSLPPLDDKEDASMLILVWFQYRAFPVPSDPGAQNLLTVDWEAHAVDVGF